MVSIAAMEGMKERTIVVNGVSKTYAMTGWRIGYMAAPENIAKAASSLQSQTTSGANSIAQYASCEALNGSMDDVNKMKKAFKERRDKAVELIKKIENVTCVVPHGAFYIMINVSKFYGKSYKGKKILSSMDFASVMLDEALVAVIPGEAFGAPEYVRMSYAVSMEHIKEGISRINEFTQQCG